MTRARWLILAVVLIAVAVAAALYLHLGVRGKPTPASRNGESAPAAADGAPRVFDTVYAFLKPGEAERPGYGLYSYALLTGEPPRSQRFLVELFRTTTAAADSLVDPKRLNIMHLPVREDWNPAWRPKAEALDDSAAQFLRDGYNQPLAQKLLSQLCAAPAESVKALCAGDLSRGPYLLTYTGPISTLPQFPPPYLVLDLSDVHEAAFGEFLAAYKTQIKRADYTDRERIDTFRLELLKIVVPASEWVGPVMKAVGDILHAVDG